LVFNAKNLLQLGRDLKKEGVGIKKMNRWEEGNREFTVDCLHNEM